MKQFNDYLKVILKHEGGYVNNSSDPGGETNYGISKRSYPGLDIKNITTEDASNIYYNDYWVKLNIDKISNEDLKLHIFDMSVNAGIKVAVKLLQSIVKTTQDGIVGSITLSKVNNEDLVDKYKESRINYYNNLVDKNPKLSIFLKGWISRVNTTKFNNE
jgi:lysozyme family protein